MRKYLSFSISLSVAALFTACASSNVNMDEVLSKMSKKGIQLPYEVLRTDVLDMKTNKVFEIRNGGYGSDMVAHPKNNNQFYALTDRGPNAKYKGAYGK